MHQGFGKTPQDSNEADQPNDQKLQGRNPGFSITIFAFLKCYPGMKHDGLREDAVYPDRAPGNFIIQDEQASVKRQRNLLASRRQRNYPFTIEPSSGRETMNL